MCDSNNSQLVVVKANPNRKTYRTNKKNKNKIPDDILSDPKLNEEIKKLPCNYNFEIHKTIWKIREYEAKRVALQMPEGLLIFSTVICDIIEQFTIADTVIMADVTYGACCVDDYTARTLGVDFLIHYGHSCLVSLDHMRDLKIIHGTKLALAGTIQFVDSILQIAPELKQSGYSLIIPQSRPLAPGELLGCTAPVIKDIDAFVFLGDGRFHLEAAMIANPSLKDKFYKYDPYEKKLTKEMYDYDEMHSRRKKAIEAAELAGSIGIIFGTLGRQGSMKVFNYLQKQLKNSGKPWVNILLSEITPQILGKLNLGAYIQTSCPRLSIDWGSQYPAPLLTPYESAVTFGKQQLSIQYPMDYYAVDSLGPWTPNSRECCGEGSECCGKGCSES